MSEQRKMTLLGLGLVIAFVGSCVAALPRALFGQWDMAVLLAGAAAFVFGEGLALWQVRSSRSSLEKNGVSRDEFARRRRMIWLIFVPIFVSGVTVGAISGLPSTAFGGWKLAAQSVAVGVFLASAGVMLRLFGKPVADWRQVVLRRADAFQRRRAVGLANFAVGAPLITRVVWTAAGQIVDGSDATKGFIVLASIFAISLTYMASVLGLGAGKLKFIFDDEFSRHVRSHAVMTGFAVAICGAVTVFVVGVSDPALAVRAVPLVLLYAIAAASATYAFMDLRADRGD